MTHMSDEQVGVKGEREGRRGRGIERGREGTGTDPQNTTGTVSLQQNVREVNEVVASIVEGRRGSESCDGSTALTYYTIIRDCLLLFSVLDCLLKDE